MVKTVAKKKYNKVRDQRNKYKRELNNPLTGGVVPSEVLQPHELDTPINPNEYGGGYIARSDAYQTLYGNYLAGYKHRGDQITGLNADIDGLERTPLTGLNYAYVTLKTENNLIKDQINNNMEEYSVDNQKVYYKSKQIHGLKTVNFIMFVVYYILYLVFVAMVITRNTSFTWFSKIVIIFIMGLYPFFIDGFMQLLVFLYKYTVSLIHGDVYENN